MNPEDHVNPLAVHRYDSIPIELFTGTMLEIGAGNNRHQKHSKFYDLFVTKANNGTYLGIDIVHSGGALKIKQCDIFDLQVETYDTVLCFEVIEHICYRDWHRLFEKLKSLVKVGGHLILTSPTNQPIENYPIKNLQDHDYYIRTVVFGITRRLLSKWLPDAQFITLRRNLIKSSNHGKSILWILKEILLALFLRSKFIRPTIRHTTMTIWRKSN